MRLSPSRTKIFLFTKGTPLGASAVPLVNTNNAAFSESAQFWTGANSRDAYSVAYNTCSNWSSQEGKGGVGSKQASLVSDQVDCSTEKAVLCVQVVAGPSTDLPTDGVYAFPSMGVFKGDAGMAAMDAKCASEASASLLPVFKSAATGKEWKAMVMSNAIGRFRPVDYIPSDKPIYNLWGARMASNQVNWMQGKSFTLFGTWLY